MSEQSRRDALQSLLFPLIPVGLFTSFAENGPFTGAGSAEAEPRGDDTAGTSSRAKQDLGENKMQVYYLELVTPDVDSVCGQYEKAHGVTFGDPEPGLGGARTAKLQGGGMIGVRGPLRESETPVVRPYMLVDDIQAAVKAAAEAGGQVALPPMELPGHGTCAIVIHGGIDCGFWQV